MKRLAHLFSNLALALLLTGVAGVALAQTGTLVTIIGGEGGAVNVTDNALDVNVVAGGGSSVVSKTYADLTGFDGGAAFTVTGVVRISGLYGVTGGTAIESTSGTTLLEVGYATSPNWFLSAAIDGSNFVAGSVWNATGATEGFADYSLNAEVSNGIDITLAPDTDDLTQGSLTLYVIWEPVSDGATLVAAP